MTTMELHARRYPFVKPNGDIQPNG
jgi:hypothetical protein